MLEYVILIKGADARFTAADFEMDLSVDEIGSLVRRITSSNCTGLVLPFLAHAFLLTLVRDAVAQGSGGRGCSKGCSCEDTEELHC